MMSAPGYTTRLPGDSVATAPVVQFLVLLFAWCTSIAPPKKNTDFVIGNREALFYDTYTTAARRPKGFTTGLVVALRGILLYGDSNKTVRSRRSFTSPLPVGQYLRTALFIGCAQAR